MGTGISKKEIEHVSKCKLSLENFRSKKMQNEQMEKITGSFLPINCIMFLAVGIGLSGLGMCLSIGSSFVDNPNARLIMKIGGTFCLIAGGLIMTPFIVNFCDFMFNPPSGSSVKEIGTQTDPLITVIGDSVDDVANVLDDKLRFNAIQTGKTFLKNSGDYIDDSLGMVNTTDKTNSVINNANNANIKWSNPGSEKLANEITRELQGSQLINHLDNNSNILRRSVGSWHGDKLSQKSCTVLLDNTKSMNIHEFLPGGMRLLPNKYRFPMEGHTLGGSPQNPHGLDLGRIESNSIEIKPFEPFSGNGYRLGTTTRMSYSRSSRITIRFNILYRFNRFNNNALFQETSVPTSNIHGMKNILDSNLAINREEWFLSTDPGGSFQTVTLTQARPTNFIDWQNSVLRELGPPVIPREIYIALGGNITNGFLEFFRNNSVLISQLSNAELFGLLFPCSEERSSVRIIKFGSKKIITEILLEKGTFKGFLVSENFHDEYPDQSRTEVISNFNFPPGSLEFAARDWGFPIEDRNVS